jgi:cell division protein FtsI/penicillin-binding protein 2
MMELNRQRMEDFKGRYKYLIAFVSLAFFLIFIRLWSLQVFKGGELRRLSENNCIRLRDNPADRGMLLDRKGRILAHNRPSFEVYLVPEDIKTNPEVVIKVAEMLHVTQDEIREKIKTGQLNKENGRTWFFMIPPYSYYIHGGNIETSKSNNFPSIRKSAIYLKSWYMCIMVVEGSVQARC